MDQYTPGPGMGSQAETGLGPGRSEKGPREEGLGPAAPRSPGGTRTGGASLPPSPPQLSGITRPGAGLRPLPSALHTPLGPSPSLAKLALAIRLSEALDTERATYSN